MRQQSKTPPRMDWLEDLPFPLAVSIVVLCFVVLPIAASVVGIRATFGRTRAMANDRRRRLIRSAGIGLFSAPTLLIKAEPSVHGALVLPHFAWFGLIGSLLEPELRGVLLAVIPMAVVTGVASAILYAVKRD